MNRRHLHRSNLLSLERPSAPNFDLDQTSRPLKILTKQGPDPHGGALDYVVKGKMIGSFGLVANPAEYRNSGVMTFIVNHEGVVFQKDLGPRIAELAERMTAFNPDSSWTKVSDTELALSPAVRQSCRPRFRASSTDH
jgi:hypothetical protein